MSSLKLLRILFLAGVVGSFAVTWGMMKDKDDQKGMCAPALPMMSCFPRPAGVPVPVSGNRPPVNIGQTQSTGQVESTVQSEESVKK
jgi:hypothetical protein